MVKSSTRKYCYLLIQVDKIGENDTLFPKYHSICTILYIQCIELHESNLVIIFNGKHIYICNCSVKLHHFKKIKIKN